MDSSAPSTTSGDQVGSHSPHNRMKRCPLFGWKSHRPSATQSWSGQEAVKSQSTGSGGLGTETAPGWWCGAAGHG
jgi:hypothetical protein